MKFIQGTMANKKSKMRIAVLSGKGGTGKTLLSVNLAAAAKDSVYVDCDVEEPNGALYFKPLNISRETIYSLIPKVDADKCTGCRKCVEFCEFNALAHTGEKLLIFDDVCHSCGGCMLVCPENALTERKKEVGEVNIGVSDKVTVISGELNIGEASGIPIIDYLLENSYTYKDCTFIDCPTGSACPVMESVKDADYCVLVAEPTIFGAHNLAMVVELVTLLEKPFGVVLNKCLTGKNPSEELCKEKNIPILGRIPFDQDLGMINSQGKILAREHPDYEKMFSTILQKIQREVKHETASHSKR
jgi:MinD superfamily P-loop ATPase